MKIADVNKVTIKRVNGKVYLRLNDGDYSLLVNMANFTQYFDAPLTFGCSLDANGVAQRYFKGTLKNMEVYLME